MKRILALLLACMLLTGCAQITISPQIPQSNNPPVQVPPAQQAPTPPTSQPTPAPQKSETPPPKPSPQIKKIKVTLYYPQNLNNQGEYLVKVRQDVTVVDSAIVKAIIATLQKGDPRYGKVIPERAKLLRAWVKDRIVYLDFSQEFRTKHWGGTTGENSTIFAIVNSLTELPNVDGVQFLLEGKIHESVLGHLDTRYPLERNENLIAK